MNKSFYFTENSKRELGNYSDKNWEIYLVIESVDYLSDENSYCVDFWLYKKDKADLYILISKEIDEKGRFTFVLHPTLKKYVDYHIYVKKEKKDLVLCFLSYYFNSSIPNKRQKFYYLKYQMLKCLGIEDWEKV